VINTLKPGGDAGAIFDSLKEGLAAPLSGMGISFSSSLFGLAGSLVLGFLDLQTSQAQKPLLHRSRGLLSTTVRDLGGPRARWAGRSSRSARAVRRLESGDRAPARNHQRGRIEPGDDHRHGQSGGSNSGAGPPYAHEQQGGKA